jgi:chromosome segregation ATPase
VEADASRRLRQLQTERLQSMEGTAEVVAAAKAAEAAAEARARQARDRLDVAMSDFVDLDVSDDLYNELRQIPHERVTLTQFVQRRVYEHTKLARAALERTRVEFQAARESWSANQSSYEEKLRDLQHRTNLAEGREAAMKEQIHLQDAAVKRLQTSLADTLAQVEKLHGKGVAFDELESRCRELQSVREQQAQLVAAHTAAVEVAKCDKAAAIERAESLQAKADVLAADKAGLAAALDEARRSAHKLQDEVRHLDNKLLDAMRQRDAFQSQLVQVHSQLQSAGEERLQAEVSKLHAQTSKEIEEIRTHAKESYERELKALKESRTDAVAETQRLRHRIELLQHALAEAQAASNSTDTSKAAIVAELRGALKLKSFEVEKVAVACADQEATITKLTSENEMLREKANILQTEFMQLEASSEKARVRLEATLQAERDKTQVYERLELDLDNAVTAAGKAELEGVNTGTILQSLELNTGAPTTLRRRLRQAVMLTRELLQSQQETATLKRVLLETQVRMPQT